jgi:phage tail tape-measure protein
MKPEKQKPNEKIADPPLVGPEDSHPVGTGVGLVGGAVAGAVLGSALGPLGAVTGAVLGAGFGPIAGKGIAVALDPVDEPTQPELRPSEEQDGN